MPALLLIKNRRWPFFFTLFVATCLLAASAFAAPLKIGVHDKPPFAMKAEDGSWTGLAVEIWEIVARNAGLSYEFIEVPYEQIRPGIVDGKLDAAVGEISVSADDEKTMDFTQPYLISTIGIAVQPHTWTITWIDSIKEFLNWTVAKFLFGTFVAMLLVSLLIWVIERRHDSGHFKGGIHGIGSALWFAAVTMTTVGYGDKTPSTLLGRFVAICWMFVGVIFVSAFTATVASSMSVDRINNSIYRIPDFRHLDCAVLKGSTAEKIATRLGINYTSYESLEEALRCLSEKKIRIVVADKISLTYLQRKMAKEKPPAEFEIPDLKIRSSFLAIPVRSHHPDFEAINNCLLNLTGSPEWDAILSRWIDTELATF
ncbi:MAG: transporter substrate-binding domain-containing protein [Terrimicrobiaceae bacterium]